MAKKKGRRRTIETVRGVVGEDFVLDLKETQFGTMSSWMKQDTLKDSNYIELTIEGNRYLKLTATQTAGLIGNWLFDVRFIPHGETLADDYIIYRGEILFK